MSRPPSTPIPCKGAIEISDATPNTIRFFLDVDDNSSLAKSSSMDLIRQIGTPANKKTTLNAHITSPTSKFHTGSSAVPKETTLEEEVSLLRSLQPDQTIAGVSEQYLDDDSYRDYLLTQIQKLEDQLKDLEGELNLSYEVWKRYGAPMRSRPSHPICYVLLGIITAVISLIAGCLFFAILENFVFDFDEENLGWVGLQIQEKLTDGFRLAKEATSSHWKDSLGYTKS
jgi:hypothetical protein